MRKKISACILLLTMPLFSFSQVQGLNVNLGGKIFKNPTSETNRIQRNPYTQSKFAYAEIENIPEKHFMRYNAYSDNFEFITFKNDTLEMDKKDNFRSITFTNPYKKYCYLEYLSSSKGRTKGYLVELYNPGNLALYKKEAITYYAGKKARTSLESDLPASYSTLSYFYFFKTKTGNIILFPNNKKELTKLYPDKKTDIESFLKQNKISFDDEEDMKKIIDFLAK